MTTDSTLGGIWSYPSAMHPEQQEHPDFMCIDELRKRIVTFLVFRVDPLSYGPVRYCYQFESDGVIATILCPPSSGYFMVHGCHLDGDRLIWMYGGRSHPWRRVHDDDIPSWMPGRLAKEHAKMDSFEGPWLAAAARESKKWRWTGTEYRLEDENHGF